MQPTLKAKIEINRIEGKMGYLWGEQNYAESQAISQKNVCSRGRRKTNAAMST